MKNARVLFFMIMAIFSLAYAGDGMWKNWIVLKTGDRADFRVDVPFGKTVESITVYGTSGGSSQLDVVVFCDDISYTAGIFNLAWQNEIDVVPQVKTKTLFITLLCRQDEIWLKAGSDINTPIRVSGDKRLDEDFFLYCSIKYGEKISPVKTQVSGTPTDFALYQNYPNPFNPSTSVEYALPQANEVVVSIFNTNGQLVETIQAGYQDAGYHNVSWNASNVSAGIYFLQFKAGNFSKVIKMTLLK